LHDRKKADKLRADVAELAALYDKVWLRWLRVAPMCVFVCISLT
jgi:hypothetical protein